MSDAEIDDALMRTWEDRQLSRGERRALAQLVEEPAELRLRVRRRSFELARRFAEHGDLDKVFAWLEEVQRALATSEPAAAPARAEAHFAPRESVYQRIVRALDATRRRADLAVFTITDDRITRAILAAHQRGVALRIVSDNDKANDLGSDIERLARAGVRVRIDRTPVHMHHKFAIFDERTLLNGSFNWTRSATEENAENILLTDDETLVKAYAAEFEYCWQQAEDF